MKARDLIGRIFGLGGRVINSVEKVLDIGDNVLDIGVAITADAKEDAVVEGLLSNKQRQDRLKELGIETEA